MTRFPGFVSFTVGHFKRSMSPIGTPLTVNLNEKERR